MREPESVPQTTCKYAGLCQLTAVTIQVETSNCGRTTHISVNDMSTDRTELQATQLRHGPKDLPERFHRVRLVTRTHLVASRAHRDLSSRDRFRHARSAEHRSKPRACNAARLEPVHRELANRRRERPSRRWPAKTRGEPLVPEHEGADGGEERKHGVEGVVAAHAVEHCQLRDSFRRRRRCRGESAGLFVSDDAREECERLQVREHREEDADGGQGHPIPESEGQSVRRKVGSGREKVSESVWGASPFGGEGQVAEEVILARTGPVFADHGASLQCSVVVVEVVNHEVA